MSRRLFRKLKAPLLVFIDVTGNCNLSCKHCYNSWRDLGKQLNCASAEHLSEALANRVIDELIKSEVLSVCLTGGEPLTNYNIVKLVLRRCKDAGIVVTMNSNLTLLTQERLLELKELVLHSVLVSVLGSCSEIHDLIT